MILRVLAVSIVVVGTVVSPLWAQACDPTILSTLNIQPLGGDYRHVAVCGNIAVVASDSAIRVLDVSDPTAPFLVGQLTGLDLFGIPISDIELVGSVAIYTDSSNFLRLVDLSDPTNPRLAGDYHPDFENIIDTDVSEGKLFSVGNSGSPNGITRLDIINVNDPDAPVRIGTTDIGQFDCRSIVVEGRLAYAGGKFRNNNDDFVSIVIFDVSNPSTPTFMGRQDFPTEASTGRFENVIDIAGSNRVVFPLTRRDIHWLDTSPLAPQGRLTSPANAEWISVESDGNKLFLSQEDAGILIYDRDDPAFPNDFPQVHCGMVTASSVTDIDAYEGVIYAIDSATSTLHIFTFDRDGDGLLDDWEKNGIPYTDVNGEAQRLMLPGAHYLHKDLYVEIDSMTGYGFDPMAKSKVEHAFAKAPNELVRNPDGMDGINLHLQVDETDLAVVPFLSEFEEFDIIKESHFGTDSEHENDPLLDAKAKAYRYCVFGFTQGDGDDTTSGRGELPGNDFMVTLGRWLVNPEDPMSGGGTIEQQAGTFMHELGHNLGLGHGGRAENGESDDHSRKPNYYSVMNYTWQTPHPSYSEHWCLDYSRVKLNTLDENSLNENIGIDGSDPKYAQAMVPFGHLDQTPSIGWAKPDGSRVDWNGINGKRESSVSVDINYLYPTEDRSSPGNMLHGREDWSSLRYELNGHVDFEDGVHVSSEMKELTYEESIMPLPPIPCGEADLTKDGMLDFFDVSAFLVAFQAQNLVADFTGDQVWDFFDVSAFLDAFGSGCP